MYVFFFFNDTATTEIYTLSLHDALPICPASASACLADLRAHLQDALADRYTIERELGRGGMATVYLARSEEHTSELQSQSISYAVFCLKKKKNTSLTPRNLTQLSIHISV